MAIGGQRGDQEVAAHLRRVEQIAVEMKKESYSWMMVQPGHRVLDIGCGIGIDTVLLAERVGSSGSIVGLDASDEMIRQANERAEAAGVSDIVEHTLWRQRIRRLPCRTSL